MAEIQCELYTSLLSTPGHINTYSRIDMFKFFDDNLPINNDLHTGQFSSILAIGDSLKFSGQLVYYLLCHEVVTQKKKEMWFQVGGKLARFSIVEFAAITGLNCNDTYKVDVEYVTSRSELGISSLNFDVLADIIKNENDPQKLIRWATLMLVSYVLLPKRRNAEVDSNLYALSSDMDIFAKYPWGRHAYLALIDSLRDFNRSKHNIKNPRFGFNIYGYALAFQVWIIETFPCFAKAICAECTRQRSIPFLPRWKTKANAIVCRMSRVKKMASAQQVHCVFPLTYEFGELISLKFKGEVSDAVFDNYFQSAIANTSKEVDFANEVINNVVQAYPNQGGDSDDFEQPKPKRKRKLLVVSRRNVDTKVKKPRKENVPTSQKNEDPHMLASKGVKCSLSKKSPENTDIKKQSSEGVKCSLSKKSPENTDIKKQSSEDPLIVRGDMSSKLEMPDTNCCDDIAIMEHEEAVKNARRTTSQIMKNVKMPADALYPEWAKHIIGTMDAQYKMLTSLSSRVSQLESSRVSQLENLVNDVKFIKEHLCGNASKVKFSEVNEVEGDDNNVNLAKNDVKDDDNDGVAGGFDEGKVSDVVEGLDFIPDQRSSGDKSFNVVELEELKESEEIVVMTKANDTGVQPIIKDDDIAKVKKDDDTSKVEKDKVKEKNVVEKGDKATNKSSATTELKVAKKVENDKVKEKNVVKGMNLRRSTRNVKCSSLTITPYTQEKKKIHRKKPNWWFYGDEERKPLFEWLMNADDAATIQGCEYPRDKMFFRILLEKGRWLSDDHLADALYYMRGRVFAHPIRYKSIVLLDWIFYKHFNPVNVEKRMKEKVKDRELFKYFDGIRPTNLGKSWYHDVTNVYTPFLIDCQQVGNHFVGLDISLTTSSIRVMDCNLGLYTDDDIVKKLEPLATCLPFLLKMTTKFSHLGSFEEPFQVVRDKTLPQDTTGGNCGIFTIKYLEYAAFGCGFEDLEERYIEAHREKLAIDLFNKQYVWKS